MSMREKRTVTNVLNEDERQKSQRMTQLMIFARAAALSNTTEIYFSRCEITLSPFSQQFFNRFTFTFFYVSASLPNKFLMEFLIYEQAQLQAKLHFTLISQGRSSYELLTMFLRTETFSFQSQCTIVFVVPWAMFRWSWRDAKRSSPGRSNANRWSEDRWDRCTHQIWKSFRCRRLFGKRMER